MHEYKNILTPEFTVKLSSANLRDLEGIIFRDHYIACNDFRDEFYIMILFNDEYV